MIGSFRGKRLFAGRLFAGRLFGPPDVAFISTGPARRYRAPLDFDALRGIDEDDVLLLLATSLVAGAGVLQP